LQYYLLVILMAAYRLVALKTDAGGQVRVGTSASAQGAPSS